MKVRAGCCGGVACGEVRLGWARALGGPGMAGGALVQVAGWAAAGSFADVGEGAPAGLNGGWVGKSRSDGQPLPHAGAAEAARDEADGNVAALHQQIAQRRPEAAAVTAGAGLRIIRQLPWAAVE